MASSLIERNSTYMDGKPPIEGTVKALVENNSDIAGNHPLPPPLLPYSTPLSPHLIALLWLDSHFDMYTSTLHNEVYIARKI
jgi:hypothetical protein